MNTKDIEEMKEFYTTEDIPEHLKQPLAFMRQWLNEDRKATPMVTARDLWHWFEKAYTQHHDAEVKRAVEAERERIRVFVANNYRIDYVKPAIDLDVIMGELEPLPKPNITSDKTDV